MRIEDAESRCARSGWQLSVGFVTGEYDTFGEENLVYYHFIGFQHLLCELSLLFADSLLNKLICELSFVRCFPVSRATCFFVCSFVHWFVLSLSLSLSGRSRHVSLSLFFVLLSFPLAGSPSLPHIVSLPLSLQYPGMHSGKNVSELT